MREIAKTEAVALVNSVNPYRLEGQKTAAFEVCEQLGQAPDVLSDSSWKYGNISAYWKGFKEWHEKQRNNFTKMHGFGSRRCRSERKGREWPVIEQPETVATAITDWKSCWLAISRTEHAMNPVVSLMP